MIEILKKIVEIIKPVPNMDRVWVSGIIHLPRTEEEAKELLEWLETHKKNNTMPKRDIILENALRICGDLK